MIYPLVGIFELYAIASQQNQFYYKKEVGQILLVLTECAKGTENTRLNFRLQKNFLLGL